MEDQLETRITALELNQEEFGHEVQGMKDQVAKLTKMVEGFSEVNIGVLEKLPSLPEQLCLEGRVGALESKHKESDRKTFELLSRLLGIVEKLSEARKESLQGLLSSPTQSDLKELSSPDQDTLVETGAHENPSKEDSDVERHLRIITQMSSLKVMLCQEKLHSPLEYCIRSDDCRCQACKEKDIGQISKKVEKWVKLAVSAPEEKLADPMLRSQFAPEMGACSDSDHIELFSKALGKKPLDFTSRYSTTQS